MAAVAPESSSSESSSDSEHRSDDDDDDEGEKMADAYEAMLDRAYDKKYAARDRAFARGDSLDQEDQDARRITVQTAVNAEERLRMRGQTKMVFHKFNVYQRCMECGVQSKGNSQITACECNYNWVRDV